MEAQNYSPLLFNILKRITSKLVEIETAENETSDVITELIVKQFRWRNFLTKSHFLETTATQISGEEREQGPIMFS